MDKMTFAGYKFKPSDVIEGLNRYFAETKAYRYRRVSLEIRNGVWTSNPYYRKDVVFTNSPPKNIVCNDGAWKYYLVCDPEEVVGVAINWLREEHDIFYTPGMEVPGDFDVDEAAKEYEKETRTSDIFCEEKLKETTKDFDVDEAFKKYPKRTLRDRIEELQESRRDYIADLQKSLYEAKRRTVGLEAGHAEKTKIIDRQKTMIKDLEKQIAEEAEENRVLRGNLDYFANLAQGRQKALSNLHDDIDKVYCEIFDCSDGGPEGTYKETLQDILTEYKRVLELKNVAEEKTIKYKELARENEEKAAKYKDTAKENRVQWNNTKAQLQWAQKENLEWVKRYEKLKSELAEAVEANRLVREDLRKET